MITAHRLACCVLLAGCCHLGAGEATLAPTIRDFDAARGSLMQTYDLGWSQARRERLDRLYDEWQRTLSGIDIATLEGDARVDWLLLREHLAFERAKLVQDAERQAQIAGLLPFAATVEALELARGRAQALDPARAAGELAAIPEQVRLLRARLEAGRKPKDGDSTKPLMVTPLQAQRAARTLDGIRRALKNWNEAYSGALPDYTWWMQVPYREADEAFEGYGKFLREELAGLKGKDEDPLLGEALGAAGLERDLAHEWLPYRAQDLLATGEREFAWCEGRLKDAAKAMGLGDDWRAALARVKEQHASPGTQDVFIAEQAAAAITFVKQRDLVTVPALCEETWRISMLSREEQRQIPYAAYDGSNLLAAYAQGDMGAADKLMSMRGNNRHFTRLTTAHEVIPGHHLQGHFAQRFRHDRRLFWTPFLVEGWALYWEMALWDLGYARGPEDQVGMLFWRLHRAARIIVTLRFHLGELTPAQMVDFLVERVGHERLGATSEVRRAIGGEYSPLYQSSYMIGGLQLRALAKEMTAGGAMSVKQFNDAVLRLGPIPIELIRATLKRTHLDAASRPQWRFDG